MRALFALLVLLFAVPVAAAFDSPVPSQDRADFARAAEARAPAFRPLFENGHDYARRHRVVIERFGRFPHRNATLGRASTPEEQAFLAEEGPGF